MEKQRILELIEMGAYEVSMITDCHCDFNWKLYDGQLSCEEIDDTCYVVKQLSVNGRIIIENFLNGGLNTFHSIRAIECSPQIDDFLRFGEFLSGEKKSAHYYEKIEALAEFIIFSGYYPDRFEDFFLLVEYEMYIPVTKDEAHAWAEAYMGNTAAKFIYVDNQQFFDDCVEPYKKSLGNIENKAVVVEIQKGFFIEKALFPDIVTRRNNITNLFYTVRDKLAEDRYDVKNRVAVVDGLMVLEQTLQKLNQLLSEIDK